jgi:hypothetical protein
MKGGGGASLSGARCPLAAASAAAGARQDLKRNPDGSVDLRIQNASPGAEREANWLPAPTGKFVPMLRLYCPNEADPSIIDGSWTMPGVRKVT